jgi:hypothetical protein
MENRRVTGSRRHRIEINEVSETLSRVGPFLCIVLNAEGGWFQLLAIYSAYLIQLIDGTEFKIMRRYLRLLLPCWD